MQPDARSDPLIGTVLEGRYRLVRLLGRGGMGSVYVAEEIRLGRRYALKVLKPELAEDRIQVERFLREAKTIARLQHPNIVDIHSFGEDPSGVVFFTMELLTGEDLDSRIAARSQRPYTLRDACRWARQIACAVAVVHRNGLIHRDLKTQNVFLARTQDDQEIIKLLDFGIARPEEGSELTRTDTVLGTPSYMSPEQVCNEPIDRRSDIYSFGVLLFKLLVGRVPFTGEAIQVAMQHVSSPVPPPSTIGGVLAIPPELDALVLKAMSKRPSDRPASMDEIERALTDLLDSSHALGVPARVSSPASATTPVEVTPGPASPSPASDEAGEEVTVKNISKGASTESGPALINTAASAATRELAAWQLPMLAASLVGLATLMIWLLTHSDPVVPATSEIPPTAIFPAPVARPVEHPPPVSPVPDRPPPDPPEPAETALQLSPNPLEVEAKPVPPDPQPPRPTQPKTEPTKPLDPIVRIKEKARACRRKHGALTTAPIIIEYAVGSDGAVMRATATSDTALGACLVEAVKKVRFEPKIRLRQEISL